MQRSIKRICVAGRRLDKLQQAVTREALEPAVDCESLVQRAAPSLSLGSSCLFQRIGFRTVELVRTRMAAGTAESFYLKVRLDCAHCRYQWCGQEDVATHCYGLPCTWCTVQCTSLFAHCATAQIHTVMRVAFRSMASRSEPRAQTWCLRL